MAEQSAASAPRTEPPALTWRAHESELGFEVATLQAPLDHTDPDGPTIGVEVIRRPAGDAARRRGTLVFVPGGPAFAGVTLLPSHHRFIPAQVREAFDIVSFDPRGSGASTPVQAFESMDEMMGLFAGLTLPFPLAEADCRTWIDAFTAFGKLVRERNPELLAHISTADTARDIDLLRRALGEEEISFYGVSYGSLLGLVYANLFPERVRAMALDGTIDPVTWYHDDADPGLNTPLRVGFDLAAAQGVERFLDRVGESTSPFSAGSPEATRAKFAELLARLRAEPVQLVGPQGPATVGYATVIAQLWVVLYQTAYWAEQAERLQDLWLAVEAGGAEPYRTRFDFSGSPEGADLPPLYAAPPEQSLALLGGDTPNPEDPQSWFAQAKAAEERSGGMGLVVNWPAVASAGWPCAAHRYTGPWDRRTAGPALLIGVTGDPGTPFAVTARLAETMPGARLLTVEGEGHTVHYNPDPQVQRLLEAYLVDGELPPAGTVVQQQNPPFPSA
ncbi:alpha/beta hydrolase [Kitasatospora sp. NPDC001159]